MIFCGEDRIRCKENHDGHKRKPIAHLACNECMGGRCHQKGAVKWIELTPLMAGQVESDEPGDDEKRFRQEANDRYGPPTFIKLDVLSRIEPPEVFEPLHTLL